MVVIKEGFQSKSDFICEFIERRKKELKSISNNNVSTSLPDIVKNASTFVSITDNECKDSSGTNVKDFLKEAQEHMNESLAIDNKIKLMNNIVSNINRPNSSMKRVKTSRNYSKSDACIVDNKSIDNLADNDLLFVDSLKYESKEILLNKTDLSITNLIANIDDIINAPKVSNELWIDNEKNLPKKINSILTTEDLNKKESVVNVIGKDTNLKKSAQPKNFKKSYSFNNNIKIINSMPINNSKLLSSLYTKQQPRKISMNNRSEVPLSIVKIKLLDF